MTATGGSRSKTRPQDEVDPKGLVREAYRIEGITLGECRSIFMDWALSVSADDHRRLIATLLARYEPGAETHPMTEVLRAGMKAPPQARRRGGRAARVPPE